VRVADWRSPLRLAFLACLLSAAGCATPTLDEPTRVGASKLDTPEQRAAGDSAQLVSMAREAAEAGQNGTAADLYRRALTRQPTNADAVVGLGDALLARGDPQQAAEAYKLLLNGDRPNPAAARGFARAMLALNRPETALAQLEQANKVQPDADTLNVTGVALDTLGRHAEAQAAYRQALALAPADRRIRGNLGLSLALDGSPDEGIATLRELAEGTGSDARARQNLALAYGLKGDSATAARLSRLDLDENDVRNNIALFAALRGLDGAAAATAIPSVVVPSTQPVVPPRQPAPPEPRQGPTALVPSAAEATDLATGAPRSGSWLVDLGPAGDEVAAADRWSQLRRAHTSALAGLTRMGGSGDGSDHLLVGPLPDRSAAQALCASLRADAPNCAPASL